MKENMFGLHAGVLTEVRFTLEKATNIPLAARDNLYFGGEYFRYSDEKLSVLLHENFIKVMEDLPLQIFPRSPCCYI